jgi:GPI ethanolamine phosphate transferase 1
MVAIGLVYLAFEDLILTNFSQKSERAFPIDRKITRTVIGIQVGLIVLAMLVTRSSALSLQAKQGLPRGNQIVGWLVLGR